MKQIIIMVATIILGIALSALILGFEGSAETIADGAKTKLTNLFK